MMIFSPIFFGSRWEPLQRLLNTQRGCTVLASAAKACLSLIDAEGKGTKVETKPLRRAAVTTTHHQQRTSHNSDRQGAVEGRSILRVVSLSQASHRPPRTSPLPPPRHTSNQATHKLMASLNKFKLLMDKWTNFLKKNKVKKLMAIFVDSGITQHCLFWKGAKNHITTYVSDYTKFQDVAYTVDAVVLYVSVAVELWDFHQGTSVQNDQTHHSQSPENIVKLVFILFDSFFNLFILSTIWQSWMSHQFYSKWTLTDAFIFFCKICTNVHFVFLYSF